MYSVNPVRSFKGRGAEYLLHRLGPQPAGLVCASAGNFGQGMAYAARGRGVPLTVFPCAEVMVHVDLTTAWHAGQVLSVADRKMYLLVEMPHGLFVDLRIIARELCQAGVRPILAHPERSPELLHDDGQISSYTVRDNSEMLRRRVDQKEQLCNEFFLRRHGRNVGNIGQIDDSAFDDSSLENK